MNSITLQELFRKPDKFNIPSYQRAYAWVDKQREQFIKDLQETTYGYYLGHYLFEEDATNKVKNVIDGQQRLTTVVIDTQEEKEHFYSGTGGCNGGWSMRRRR